MNQVLHQAILLRHVPLEVDHLVENILVVVLEVADMGSHLLLRALHPVDLYLESLNCCGVVRRGVTSATRFADGRNFSLDVLQRVPSIGMEVRVSECPALIKRHMRMSTTMTIMETYVLAERVVVCVLDLELRNTVSQKQGKIPTGTHLMEIILVQLSDEAREVRVLERPRKDSLCKFIHVLYDEAVAVRTP